MAAKIYDKFWLNDSSRKKSLRHEIKIWWRIWHTKIARLYEVIETVRYIYLMQEWVEGESVQDILRGRIERKFEENEARFIIK